MTKWSGCNYAAEKDNTIISMHDCDGCPFDGDCAMQHDTQEWHFPGYPEALSFHAAADKYEAMCDAEIKRHKLRRVNHADHLADWPNPQPASCPCKNTPRRKECAYFGCRICSDAEFAAIEAQRNH